MKWGSWGNTCYGARNGHYIIHEHDEKRKKNCFQSSRQTVTFILSYLFGSSNALSSRSKLHYCTNQGFQARSHTPLAPFSELCCQHKQTMRTRLLATSPPSRPPTHIPRSSYKRPVCYRTVWAVNDSTLLRCLGCW